MVRVTRVRVGLGVYESAQTVTPTPEGLFVRDKPISPLDLSTRT